MKCRFGHQHTLTERRGVAVCVRCGDVEGHPDERPDMTEPGWLIALTDRLAESSA